MVRDDLELGRRERKKLETREALVRAALELFSERGVDGTTVDDIANAVDVSARTFHRYFATKEEVLFADSVTRRERFHETLVARPDDEPLIDSIRAAVKELVAGFVRDAASERQRMQAIMSSDVLRGHSLRNTEAFGRLVEEFAADRLGLSPDEALPRLLAASTLAVARIVRERWQENPRLDHAAEVDRCFAIVTDLRAATEQAASRRTPSTPRSRTSTRQS
jgi:AcrR family transcriptional regulator